MGRLETSDGPSGEDAQLLVVLAVTAPTSLQHRAWKLLEEQFSTPRHSDIRDRVKEWREALQNDNMQFYFPSSLNLEGFDLVEAIGITVAEIVNREQGYSDSELLTVQTIMSADIFYQIKERFQSGLTAEQAEATYRSIFRPSRRSKIPYLDRRLGALTAPTHRKDPMLLFQEDAGVFQALLERPFIL